MFSKTWRLVDLLAHAKKFTSVHERRLSLDLLLSTRCKWQQLQRKGNKEKGRVLTVPMSPYSVAKSCLILYNPMDCSPPGSSDHGILQARILEWVPISSSKGLSGPRDQTCISCIAGRFCATESPGKSDRFHNNMANPQGFCKYDYPHFTDEELGSEAAQATPWG